jgi:hypothetical protein
MRLIKSNKNSWIDFNQQALSLLQKLILIIFSYNNLKNLRSKCVNDIEDTDSDRVEVKAKTPMFT